MQRKGVRKIREEGNETRWKGKESKDGKASVGDVMIRKSKRMKKKERAWKGREGKGEVTKGERDCKEGKDKDEGEKK